MWTAPRAGRLAHNCHPDAALELARKPSPSPQDSGPPHQFRQQWRPPKMCAPCLSRPKEPSLSSLAGALLLLDSWRSRHSPEFPSLASPNSDVGRVESLCCPGSAAKFRGDHGSAQTRPCDKICSRNEWVLLQHLWAQSQRNAQHHFFPKFSSFCTFSWNVNVAGAHLCRFRRHLCHRCRPTDEEHVMASVLHAPIDSKHHLILWAASVCARFGKQKKYRDCEQKTLLTYKQHERNKTICDDGIK